MLPTMASWDEPFPFRNHYAALCIITCCRVSNKKATSKLRGRWYEDERRVVIEITNYRLFLNIRQEFKNGTDSSRLQPRRKHIHPRTCTGNQIHVARLVDPLGASLE